MEEDELEEVQGEMDNAKTAWVKVLSSATKQYIAAPIDKQDEDEEEDDKTLSQLMPLLGTTYSEEEHDAALKKVARREPAAQYGGLL
jgi:hypothetical protein